MTQMVIARILNQFCQSSKSMFKTEVLNVTGLVRNCARERKICKVDAMQRITFCCRIQKHSCAILKTKVKPRKVASGVGHFCFHCCWFWFTTAFLSLYWLVASWAFLEPSSTLINKFCCTELNVPQLCHNLLLFCLPWKYMNAIWMFRQLIFWDWKEDLSDTSRVRVL